MQNMKLIRPLPKKPQNEHIGKYRNPLQLLNNEEQTQVKTKQDNEYRILKLINQHSTT